MNPPGRFLDKNTDTGLWSDIGDRKAIEKTSQALRDGAAVLRKQLSEDLGDPEFLSVVFENGDTSTGNGSDRSSNNSQSSAEAKKQEQMAQTEQQTATCKPRLTKSRSAKKEKGHRRTKTAPNSLTSSTEGKKVPKTVRMDQVAPHVPPSTKKTAKPVLKAQPQALHQQSQQQPTGHVRSYSYDETAATEPTKRPERTDSSTGIVTPVTSNKLTTVATVRPHMAYSSSIEEELMEEFGDDVSSAWALGHSRNSSTSSGAMALPPFFPMSPIGGGRHPHHPHHPQPHLHPQHIYHPNHQMRQAQQQHIFSCFQEPKGRPPMSPMHRSWSPRDFNELSPFHDTTTRERHSTGGVTLFSDGDIDMPSLDISFDRAFAMDSDDNDTEMQHMASSILSPRQHADGATSTIIRNDEEGDENSSSRCGTTSNNNNNGKNAMDDDDMSLHFPPTLEFAGNKNDLDDVMMKDSDTEERELTPLSFMQSESGDSNILDALPDLLSLPISPGGHYDKAATTSC